MKQQKKIYIYDCFDTLLYIDSNIPRQWCAELSTLLRIEETVTKKLRRQSELTVSSRSVIGEYTFQNMLCNFWQRYEMLVGFNCTTTFDVFMEKALQEEIADLHRITFPNTVLQEEIRRNQKNGIPSYVLSDFYIGKEYLQQLLVQKQFEPKLFKKIIVSCDINANKSSGTAYSYLIDHYGIVPQDCLMTGDNFRSDCYNARRAGFEVRLWKKKQRV